MYGRTFIIYTDRKPLSYLFDASRAIPHMAFVHIRRWAITLSACSYIIEHKLGRCNLNVDALSRFPLSDTPEEIPTPADAVFLLDHMNSMPGTTALIRQWTLADPVLSKVKAHVELLIISRDMPIL